MGATTCALLRKRESSFGGCDYPTQGGERSNAIESTPNRGNGRGNEMENSEMDLSQPERLVLERFHEKCRMAGGPRAGYMLRKQAIVYRHPQVDLEPALAGLVGRELLKVSESGQLYYLTASGTELLQSWGS